ncbi:hypothetical protein F4775DRAFT_555143 [Biscogniauxia sp. FL1348]|nr:hypothetical protein F4775DRAFT_555143 [Biscogniauxia sp. FL1348]
MLSLVAQLAPRPCQVGREPHPPAEIGKGGSFSPLQPALLQGRNEGDVQSRST